MRLLPHSRRAFGERGVGLVELMIALVLGLLLVIALSYFFLGGRMLNRAGDDVARMQESGRNALELMGRAIRQAGYRTNVSVTFPGTVVTGLNGAGTAPDQITVQYNAQSDGDISCTGGSVAGGGMLTAEFKINTATNPPALLCNDVVVVENIENMQISYGIDPDKSGNLENYYDAPTAAQFLQAASVRVSLLVRGPSANVAAGAPGSTAPRSQTYTYNGATVTKDDGYLRQVFTATFTVRNQAW